MAKAKRKNVEEEHIAVMAEGQLSDDRSTCFRLCNLFPLSDPQQVVFIHRISATGELKLRSALQQMINTHCIPYMILTDSTMPSHCTVYKKIMFELPISFCAFSTLKTHTCCVSCQNLHKLVRMAEFHLIILI